MDIDALQQGIQAARQGRRAEARAWLREALRRNPNSEQAWLWLSTVVETDAEYQMCLERALAINPLNETTRARLQDALRSSHHGVTSRRSPGPIRPQASPPPRGPITPTIHKSNSPSAASVKVAKPIPTPKTSESGRPAAPQVAISPEAQAPASQSGLEQAPSAIPMPALAVMGCLTITAISGLLVLISLVLMGWAS
jgi:hypothetical protein